MYTVLSIWAEKPLAQFETLIEAATWINNSNAENKYKYKYIIAKQTLVEVDRDNF
jgi:hypothetical protein